jgi:hypothetical protein
MAECPIRKSMRKTKRDLDNFGKNLQNGFNDVQNGFNTVGRGIVKGSTQITGALPPLDMVRMPSKSEIDRVFNVIRAGLQVGSDALIDGLFDSSKVLVRAFDSNADLSELDRAQEDAKDAIDAAINAVLDVISDEIKLIASIGEKLLKVYQLVRENKWKEAGELLAQALKDSVIALIPLTLRTALELVKKNIDKVLKLLKELAVYMGTLVKQSLQHNPITMLVRAIDSKAADEMDNAIGGAVDGVIRIVTDTVDAAGAVLKAPATIISGFKEGDFEKAGQATANGLVNAVTVIGTVAGGFTVTALAGAAGGIAGRYTSSQNAMWVEFGLGFMSPGKAPKNLFRIGGGASDEFATAGGRNLNRGGGAASRTNDAHSPNRINLDIASPGHQQMPVQPKLEKPAVKKPDEESLADDIDDLADDVATPKTETLNGAEAVTAAKKKKVKLDTKRNADKAHEADKAEAAKAADEAKKKKDAEEDNGNDPMDALDVAAMAGSMALVGASAATDAAAVAAAALLAARHLATQVALSKIAQEAATQAALLKLNNDLHDSNASFMKGIGSSVKAAAQ